MLHGLRRPDFLAEVYVRLRRTAPDIDDLAELEASKRLIGKRWRVIDAVIKEIVRNL